MPFKMHNNYYSLLKYTGFHSTPATLHILIATTRPNPINDLCLVVLRRLVV